MTPSMPTSESTDDFGQEQNLPTHLSVSERVTRLETARHMYELNTDRRLRLIEEKLDTLIDSANQRKGIEKVAAIIIDACKLIAAAGAGAFFARYFHV